MSERGALSYSHNFATVFFWRKADSIRANIVTRYWKKKVLAERSNLLHCIITSRNWPCLIDEERYYGEEQALSAVTVNTGTGYNHTLLPQVITRRNGTCCDVASAILIKQSEMETPLRANLRKTMRLRPPLM